MRPTALAAVALTACVLAGCGKSGKNSEDQQSHAAGSEQPTPASEPSEAEKSKTLASLPAPYNTADLNNGKAKFALCASCHTIAAGAPNMTGPNLHGVIGRKAGTLPGYNFSDAVKKAGFGWNAQHLDPWITQPRSYLPGTKMTFAGLKDPKDRTDVIAYVMVESGYRP